jgi:adenylosuccinate synthase
MKKAQIIIGANFGDEGKGLTTDYLSYGVDDAVVVRFNGGAQAGHTVQTPHGNGHVFRHFGSGTLNDITTFLSKYFVVNPAAFGVEQERLTSLNCRPRVYVDVRAPLTTPYDVMINQAIENHRGNKRHGSCGFGINETIERNIIGATTIADFYTTAFDFLDLDRLRIKLGYIRDVYLPHRLIHLGVVPNFGPDELSDEVIDKYIEQCNFMAESVILVDSPERIKDFTLFIFEGAQGLLLDEKHRWFPHVTRSRTGVHNAVELMKELEISDAEVYYVTRGYLTRHGAGPLPFEVPYLIYPNIIDATNTNNAHQGPLRFAPLNLDLLKESITGDLKTVSGVKLTPNLVLTCVNQLPDQIRYVKCGIILENDFPTFLCAVKSIYKFDKVLISKGCTRTSFSNV